jgi:hypothetical protein
VNSIYLNRRVDVSTRKKQIDEATLLELLRRGDLAGVAIATGMTRQQVEQMLRDTTWDDECCDDEDSDEEQEGLYSFGDDFFDDDDDDFDGQFRPDWLHPDCRNVCSALNLGTCCLYPDNPLVRIAVDLAESVARTVNRLADVGCDTAALELARWFRLVPGLLAQIHAILPRLNQTALSQLLCPVGTLASALDQSCGNGCPWGCDNPAKPDRRAEFEPLIELVAECSTAIRTRLGWMGGPGRTPIVVRPRSPGDERRAG